MEEFYAFLATSGAGVIVAVVGYFLNLSAVKREREERARAQLITASRGIVSELEANLRIVREPFQGWLIPLVTSIFATHAGEITKLPSHLQNAIYQAYIELTMGNAIVQTDLNKVHWGQGYLNEQYKRQCQNIIQKGQEAERLLEEWLKKEAGEETPPA